MEEFLAIAKVSLDIILTFTVHLPVWNMQKMPSDRLNCLISDNSLFFDICCFLLNYFFLVISHLEELGGLKTEILNLKLFLQTLMLGMK